MNRKASLAVIFLMVLFPAIAAESLVKKYLCIGETAGGLIHRGAWTGTAFEAGEKFLITTRDGALVSIKDFGAPDEFSITNCYLLEPTKSFACVSNFDMFRFQPSTRRFVFAKTAGFTTEYEEEGVNLPSTDFTPHIVAGSCEAL